VKSSGATNYLRHYLSTRQAASDLSKYVFFHLSCIILTLSNVSGFWSSSVQCAWGGFDCTSNLLA
jgi:hypothetical protein